MHTKLKLLLFATKWVRLCCAHFVAKHRCLLHIKSKNVQKLRGIDTGKKLTLLELSLMDTYVHLLYLG